MSTVSTCWMILSSLSRSLGPWKLAFVLNKCLNRYESPKENTQPTNDVDLTLSLDELLIADPQELQPQDLSTIEEPFPRRHNPNSGTQGQDSSSSATSSSPFMLVETDIQQSMLVHPELGGARDGARMSPRILITDDNVINRKVSTTKSFSNFSL